MRNRANAMAEMKALLKARKSLYMLADTVVDTSTASLEQAAARIVGTAVSGRRARTRAARTEAGA
jgi:hypothetical protein